MQPPKKTQQREKKNNGQKQRKSCSQQNLKSEDTYGVVHQCAKNNPDKKKTLASINNGGSGGQLFLNKQHDEPEKYKKRYAWEGFENRKSWERERDNTYDNKMDLDDVNKSPHDGVCLGGWKIWHQRGQCKAERIDA
eukprot:1254912-Ditylum_brightwellii.AAC.1